MSDRRTRPENDKAGDIGKTLTRPDVAALPVLFSVGQSGAPRRAVEVKRKRTRAGEEYLLVVLEK